jgi:hypothetical protein
MIFFWQPKIKLDMLPYSSIKGITVHQSDGQTPDKYAGTAAPIQET